MENLWPWVGFNFFVLALLALDLGLFHRKAHAVSIKEAALWSVVWIGLALAFNVVIYFWRGQQIALEFLTGYLVEKSLSVDNIFVFLLIFSAFAVPKAYQHRVLFWGILGALVMRGALILVGAALLEQFHWVFYIFGGFLVLTGIRMGLHRNEEEHPENNAVVQLFRRFVPVTRRYEGTRFAIQRARKWIATPLLLVLVVVESSDLLFAVDSIPAVFAVTQDPFIVYTSNVFAILGLRSLYFLLSGVVGKFYYLKLGLAGILVLVGVKMLIADWYTVPIIVSLAAIGLILLVAAAASLWRARRLEHAERLSPASEPAE